MSSAFQGRPVGTEDDGRGRNPVTVTVAKPREIGLADWMSDLRDWFDKHGIEPAGFKRCDGEWGNQSYEVSFADRHQADRFAAGFRHRAVSCKLAKDQI